MIKAVVFDLDDTLIAERDYARSGYRHIAGVMGRKLGLPAEQVFGLLTELASASPLRLFDRLLERLGMPYESKDIREMVDEYRNHKPDIAYYDDVLPCLAKLRENGVRIGIITDGYACAQRRKLEALRAEEQMDHIVVTDELGGKAYWKPHPQPFETMRDRLGVQFGEMMYVGDNPEKDFYIGSLFPITTVRINRDGYYRDRNYLNGVREHAAIRGLEELPGLL